MVKVIFLENIEDYHIGDVKDVPDGYARNFLFKKGLAKVATVKEIENVNSRLKEINKAEEEKVKAAQLIAAKLGGMTLQIPKEVNEEGHLYGSLSNKEISEALELEKFVIDPANINIDVPIKKLGESLILIKVGHGVEAQLKIEVVRK